MSEIVKKNWAQIVWTVTLAFCIGGAWVRLGDVQAKQSEMEKYGTQHGQRLEVKFLNQEEALVKAEISLSDLRAQIVKQTVEIATLSADIRNLIERIKEGDRTK